MSSMLSYPIGVRRNTISLNTVYSVIHVTRTWQYNMAHFCSAAHLSSVCVTCEFQLLQMLASTASWSANTPQGAMEYSSYCVGVL